MVSVLFLFTTFFNFVYEHSRKLYSKNFENVLRTKEWTIVNLDAE